MNPNPDSPTRGSRRTRRILAGFALAAAVAAGGAGIAQAAAGSPAPAETPATTTESSTTVPGPDDAGDDTTAPADDAPATDDGAPADRPARPDNGETDVTGADAEASAAAALAAVPGGTVKHVTTDTDDGGAFEVHMTDADGNRVKVILDANFAVVETLTGGPGGPGAGRDNGETEVTGADADSASAAALAAVPGGTVKRVTTDTDDGGAFEVHMTDADGNRVKVILDANFAVVDTLTGGPGGPGGPGGHNGEAEVTDSTIALQASAAALDAVPGGTVDRVTTDTDDGGAYEVHVTDADGNRVKVILDENFAVLETLTGGPGGPGGRGGRGGRDQATDDAAATDSTASDAALSTSPSTSLSA